MSEDKNKVPEGKEGQEEESFEAKVAGLIKNRDEILQEKKDLEKRLKKFEADQAERDRKKLEEDGKLKELLDLERKEKEELKSQNLRIQRFITLEKTAKKLGFDEDYIDVIFKEIEWDEDNKVKDAEKFFKELKERKPKLFVDGVKEVPATGTVKPNTAAYRSDHTYTDEELGTMPMSHFIKHHETIQDQVKEGKVR